MSPTDKVKYKNMADFGFGPIVMKKTKVCVKCGLMVQGQLKNCPDCGERLPRETLFDEYKRRHLCCPYCDTVLAEDSLYCPNCGKPVRKDCKRKNWD